MQATFADVERTHLVSGLEEYTNKVRLWNERRVNFRTLHSRCNSAFSQLHIELMATDTLCSDVLSNIFLYAWFFL